MRIAGLTAIVAGTGLTVAAPASAAPVPDAVSLRAEISRLNGTGPEAEIELVPGVVYALPGATACYDEDDNRYGDLDVRRTQPLKIFTLDGAAPAVLRMECDPATSPQRILDVKAPPGLYGAGRLTLRNVILRDGHAPTGVPLGDGGAVRSVGNIVIENSRFENNAAGAGNPSKTAGLAGERGGSGGAVATFGTVTIDGSTFSGNEAGSAGAGFSTTAPCTAVGASGGGPGGAGGAVFAATGGLITNSTFSGNEAGNGGDGGSEACTTDSAPGDGAAGGAGGGGAAVACGTVLIDQTYRCHGDLTVRASTFNDNETGAGGTGGSGAADVLAPNTPGNASSASAASASSGSAPAGGAAAGGGLDGNAGAGGNGGALQLIGDSGDTRTQLTLENSTFDANNTNGGGQGTALHASFDGAFKLPLIFLTHVTMVGGTGGGTLFVEGTSWVSTATVIGGSDGPDCSQAADTATFSKSTDESCGFGADNVHPFEAFALAPLASNGGPTQTRSPGAGSVLLDAVEPLILATGQGGTSRPQGGNSDIGAVELVPAASAGSGSDEDEDEDTGDAGQSGGAEDNSSGGSAGTWPGAGANETPDPDASPDPSPQPSTESADPAADPTPVPANAVQSGGGGTLTETGFRIAPVAVVGALLVSSGGFMLIRARKPGRHRLDLRLREA